MTRFVEVAVIVPKVSTTYHYHLPAELETRVSIGSLVVVPFGRQTVQGIVLDVLDTTAVGETKPVMELVDAQPVVLPTQIRLAEWMAKENLTTLAACLECMIPPGLSRHADILIHLKQPIDQSHLLNALEKDRQARLEHRLLTLLQERGDLRGHQLEVAFPRQNWRLAVLKLQKLDWVTVTSQLAEPAVKPKKGRLVAWVQDATPEQLAQAALGRQGSQFVARRLAVLEFLRKEPEPMDVSWVKAQTAATPTDLQKLADLGLIAFTEEEVWRDPVARLNMSASQPLMLTHEQSQALDELLAGMQKAEHGESPQPFLLHGVTSSGKTEIYLQAVAETLRRGKQALVMVPEISLTPQTIRRFVSRFPGQVGVIHSRLSPGERFDTWRRARAGKLPVIIGPRSALFAPLAHLGLIVIDECHDESYYQDEMAPSYHSVSSAIAYGRICQAVVVLGSATPDVTQMYQAESGAWKKLSLPHRLKAHQQEVEVVQRAGANSAEGLPVDTLELPPVSIVDMRQELKDGNHSIFSRDLQMALQATLEANQQAILFLNRRGSASYVFCRSCGQSLRCPRCDRILTFHSAQSALICHTCGYRRQMPQKCPHCGSPQIRQFGTGTEKVEEEVQKLCPKARLIRWDADTTQSKDAHDLILSKFTAHQADILVGTQMLAKGLDLPLVTLVGVILAEVSLGMPDYRAGERTFQVLTQVAGRAGRSALGGQVIFQTFQPEHYAIQAAASQDYAAFYQQELAKRQSLGYPPFAHLLRLEVRHQQAPKAEQMATALGEKLRARLQSEALRATSLIGPVPCFFARQNGYYRWQVIICGPDPAKLLKGLSLEDSKELSLEDWRIEYDPLSLL